MAKKKRIPHKFQPWIDARKKFKLSDAAIFMARELGLGPKKLGGYAPSKSQPWKPPLGEFIESLYLKRFKTLPQKVRSIEQLAADHLAKREAKKAAKSDAASQTPAPPETPSASDS